MNAPWMRVAMQEIGTREIGGSRRNNNRIVEYLRTVCSSTRDETPWCSAFANWVMVQAGMEGSGRANARSWMQWGYPLAYPYFGAVTVFWRESRSSWKGHVAFFVNQIGNKIFVLGGNQGDSVSVSDYPSSRLLGYRWPNPVGSITSTDAGGNVTHQPIEGMVITASPR